MADYEFGVTAKGEAVETFSGTVYATDWCVCLPHQCDDWEITLTPDKATAVAEMEAFIAQAQFALEKLRAAPDPPS